MPSKSKKPTQPKKTTLHSLRNSPPPTQLARGRKPRDLTEPLPTPIQRVQAELKTRIITLTNQRPVKIREDEWPAIAEASGDSFKGDVGRYEEAIHQGECDKYTLKVRQHKDGRCIVYGVTLGAIPEWKQPAGGKSYRGGELLEKGEDVIEAILRVGKDCRIVDSVIQECIGNMPPEEL